MVFQEPRLVPGSASSTTCCWSPRPAREIKPWPCSTWSSYRQRGALARQLSGGMQPARGARPRLARKPDLLLLDEPLISLDSTRAERLRARAGGLLAGGEAHHRHGDPRSRRSGRALQPGDRAGARERPRRPRPCDPPAPSAAPGRPPSRRSWRSCARCAATCRAIRLTRPGCRHGNAGMRAAHDLDAAEKVFIPGQVWVGQILKSFSRGWVRLVYVAKFSCPGRVRVAAWNPRNR